MKAVLKIISGIQLLRRVIDSHRLESNVTQSTGKIITMFRGMDLSEPMEIHTYTTNIVYNILAALCFGVVFEMDDPLFLELMEIRRQGELKVLESQDWMFLKVF